MIRLIQLFSRIMEIPKSYGWFHLISFALVIVLSIVLTKKFKDKSDKTYRKVVFIVWIVIIIFEIYKQITFSYTIQNDHLSFNYQWYAFPFQFCSSPLYICPFIVFLKDGKVRNACIAFISTFSLFAGFAVIFYPEGVFTNIIGINIQTMVHHGTQIIIGMLSLGYNKKCFSFKYFASGILVFCSLLAVAMVLNLIVPLFVQSEFNMFFISPRFGCHLPILSLVREKAPYIIFLLIYILGFSLVAFIVYEFSILLIKLIDKKKYKKL